MRAALRRTNQTWFGASAAPIVCGVFVLLGALAPWASGTGGWSTTRTYLLGVFAPEGRFVLIAGGVTIMIGLWQRKRREPRLPLTALMGVSFGLIALVTLYRWWDPSVFTVYPGGGGPIEGWMEFGPSWGSPLVAIASLFGLVATVTRWFGYHAGTGDG